MPPKIIPPSAADTPVAWACRVTSRSARGSVPSRGHCRRCPQIGAAPPGRAQLQPTLERVTPDLDALLTRPIRSAAALGLGVPRRELAGPAWQRLSHGVAGWCALDATDPDVRIRTIVEAQPPGAVLGGWAALRLQGLTEFDGRTGGRAERLLPVLLHVGPRGRTRPTPLLDVDRGAVAERDVRYAGGFVVMRPVAAVAAIARRYGAEEGLVAADAASRAGLTSPGELRAYVRKLSRQRGVRAARLTAELVDPAAASMPESRLRYVWVMEAGLPRPLVNVRVTDSWGRPLGDPDLLDLEAATAAEYDGSHHRELARHTHDNAREELLESANLVVVRATSIDLWPQRRQLVQRLRHAHRRGLARDRSRDRFGLARPA